MPDETKMNVKVYELLYSNLAEQLDRLCLKRDAFITKVIATELEHLAKDMRGKRNSTKAKRHISGALHKLPTRPVNIVINKVTATSLNEIVERSNMVRDAFVNRLIMFLRSSDTLLAELRLPKMVHRSEFKSSVEEMPTSPLKAIEAVQSDPLYYLRIAAEERLGQGLYSIHLPEKLHGFACYLDDEDVPDTKSNKQKHREMAELAKSLAIFEHEAFTGRTPK